NKTAFATVVLVAALLVTGTIVSALLAIRATTAEGLAGTRLEAANTERARALEAVQEAKQRLYDSKLAEARASRWSGRVGPRYQGLSALAEAARVAGELGVDQAHLLELRNEAIACLALPDFRRISGISGDWPPETMPVVGFDADLELFARNDREGTISVRHLADDQEVARLTGGGKGGASFNFSPGGDLLAVCYRDQLPGQATNFQVWDWRHDKVVFQPEFSVSGDALSFTADGRHLALGQGPGQGNGVVTLHEVATGKEVRRLNLDLTPTHLAV